MNATLIYISGCEYLLHLHLCCLLWHPSRYISPLHYLLTCDFNSVIRVDLRDLQISNISIWRYHCLGEVAFMKIWNQYWLPSDTMQQSFFGHLPCPSSNVVYRYLELTLHLLLILRTSVSLCLFSDLSLMHSCATWLSLFA